MVFVSNLVDLGEGGDTHTCHIKRCVQCASEASPVQRWRRRRRPRSVCAKIMLLPLVPAARYSGIRVTVELAGKCLAVPGEAKEEADDMGEGVGGEAKLSEV